MTVFEIEEDVVDCVDEEFDEASREWEDDEDTGDDVIPELTVTEEIGGTIYTVSGTYEGSEGLDKKLARIMLHNLEDF